MQTLPKTTVTYNADATMTIHQDCPPANCNGASHPELAKGLMFLRARLNQQGFPIQLAT